MQLQHAIVFITGANRGLGLAFAQEALRRGARKVYAGTRQPTGANVPGIIDVVVDVTDPESVRAAAALCADTTLVINNAGIAQLHDSVLDADLVTKSRALFETNYYGMIHVSQALAPVLAANGGGAFLNVLSDATWFARPMLAAYSASKSAAWAFTNALRIDMRAQGTAVLALHVSFIDTGMTAGFDMQKNSPHDVAQAALDGIERHADEVLADDFTVALKGSLATGAPFYLDPPAIA
jgi:NAD(P)-dependent dehydrogenase (short-subunit alcohol dehydrogenase family)